ADFNNFLFSLTSQQFTYFNNLVLKDQDKIRTYLEQNQYSEEAQEMFLDILNILATNPNISWTLIKDWFLNTPNYTEVNLNINSDNITYDEPLTQQALPSMNDFVGNFPKMGTSGNYTEMATSDVYELA